MKRNHVIFALLSLCLIASAVWWFSQPTTGSVLQTPALPRQDAPIASTATRGPQAPAFRWEVGAVAFYDLETGVALAPAGEGAKLTPGSALLIRGTLRMEVLRIAPLEIAATLASAHILREGASDQEMQTMLESTPCLLRMQRDGSIEETTFAPEVPEEDRNLVRLACAWEFRLQPKTTWTSQEKSPGSKGNFQATYVAIPGGTVKKSRIFLPFVEDTATQRVLFSEFIARPGALWLETLEGRESTEMLLDGKPIARSLVHIRLTRMNEGPATTSAAPDPRAFDGFSAEVTANPRESVNARLELDNLRKLYGAVPLATMASKLAEVREKAMQEKLPALRELTDWLRAHGSEGAMQAVATILAGNLDAEVAGMTVHAVGNAKEADAIARLLEAPDKLAPTSLLQAIIEAGGVQNPSERIINALSELTSKEFPKAAEGDEYHLNNAAWYNLFRLGEKDAALRHRLEDSLLPTLGGNDPDMIQVALLAAANARSDRAEYLETSARVLNSAEQENSMRIAALRFLSQTPSLTIVAAEAATGALRPGVSPDVQAAALEVFEHHPSQLESATLQRINSLMQSTSQSVAYAARKAAAASGKTVPNR